MEYCSLQPLVVSDLVVMRDLQNKAIGEQSHAHPPRHFPLSYPSLAYMLELLALLLARRGAHWTEVFRGRRDLVVALVACRSLRKCQ